MNILRRAFISILLAVPFALAAEPVAFVTNVKGDVAVDGARAAVLAELARGQKLALAKEALASVMYIASGKEYMLKGPAEFVVQQTEVAGTGPMPPVTRNTEWRASGKTLVQVAQTSAASVRMRSAAPPKSEPAATLVFPTEGSIASLQPAFQWHAKDAKAPAEFALMIVGQADPVHKAKVTGGTYKLPAKLKPETEYAWIVTAGGQELGSAKFHTLPAEALQRIEARRPSSRAEFSDRLLFALMLQEMGARQEAKESWAALAKERPDLPELAALAR